MDGNTNMAQPTEAAAFDMHPLTQFVMEPAAIVEETKRENRGTTTAVSLNIIFGGVEVSKTFYRIERFLGWFA
jgi:hypothetical protein